MPEKELLRLLPKVLRARDFHLYLEGGKRLTDLWLAGGKAVLGHKPPQVLRELKNAGERGLFTPLPHPAEGRFIKALENFFPGRTFRLYASRASLFRALEEAGFAGDTPVKNAPFPDPAFSAEAGEASPRFWRPFLEPPDNGKASILIPVLPLPLGPEVLVLDKATETLFPPGELIPPVLLSPAARALYDLAAAAKSTPPEKSRRYPKIEKSLESRRWSRRGIYLKREKDTNEEEYSNLFVDFLKSGFLVSPFRADPLILPAAMSPGEESALAGLLMN